MQATITYLLTEQAQRAQMMATGQPVARKQTTTLDIHPDDLQYYPILPDGSINLDLSDHVTTGNPIKRELSDAGNLHEYDSLPDVPAMLRAARELKQAVRESVVSADASIAARIDANDPQNYEPLGEPLYRIQRALDAVAIPDCPASINPRYSNQDMRDILPHLPLSTAADDRWIARSRVAIVERKEREAAESRARAAAEDAREQAKLDYIAGWIAKHADEQTQQQFADDLLCRSAALDLIANVVFASAGVPEAASWDDVYCRNSDCPCGSKDLDCLPRSVYPAWRAIKAGIPTGYTVKFERVREHISEENIDPESDEPTAGPPIYLARITIQEGPFQFERTIKLN